MLNSTIILYGLFAGIVAILVTVSIEKFGGLIGGVLGTVPSTIIPAAAGVYALEGDGALTASMSVVPIGMLINGMFLGVWIILPKYIANESLKLPITVFLSLCTWAVLALISLIVARQVTNGMISELMLGMVGLALLAILSIMFNVKHRATPKGENKVPISILSLRGVAAGLAIAACLVLAEIGLPFVAGLASAFPAIFAKDTEVRLIFDSRVWLNIYHSATGTRPFNIEGWAF